MHAARRVVHDSGIKLVCYSANVLILEWRHHHSHLAKSAQANAVRQLNRQDGLLLSRQVRYNFRPDKAKHGRAESQ
jgi:hypothetical protein